MGKAIAVPQCGARLAELPQHLRHPNPAAGADAAGAFRTGQHTAELLKELLIDPQTAARCAAPWPAERAGPGRLVELRASARQGRCDGPCCGLTALGPSWRP